MIELPEATTMAEQIRRSLAGAIVTEVEVNRTPHKMAFFTGDPHAYADHLKGRPLTGAVARGGLIEITVGDHQLVLSDGAYPRLVDPDEAVPDKHQLALVLEDGASLVVSVQMYGGMSLHPIGENDNPYYLTAVRAPSPLGPAFDDAHVSRLLAAPGVDRLSAKAFLATEQRIPGLGNGVLQDILWFAHVHPKRKMGTLDGRERAELFHSVRQTLREMTHLGGRSTERDARGNAGGYSVVMGRTTRSLPCARCGSRIVKEAYLGGAVYYCPDCQL